ncbi:polynucleotide adenylyltransferase PcnB [Piscinibacter sp. Jin2]|uniref:Poly(A) polymerase I n=1 Tax=Aquariibacter lacus TaxID=2801332 RepID=A0A9X0XG52_9BURK|nr:polynucleotide adenylyltransferase PcnB [Piscinibacter lacus]
MIKKLIDKLLGKGAGQPAAGRPAEPPAPLRPRAEDRREIPASEHRIDPKLLDERAVRVVETLQQAGHEAYIVGGAVRDLLLGLRPKDFDVATSATPEQVKGLFRRAFIIGRRFRIVHVIHGRGREHEVIEVSTFRALLDSADAATVNGNEKTAKRELEGRLAGQGHVVDASGRVLRDNVWGPQHEDAARRDFTVNAMYYDPVRELVVDYHGGYADARARRLRMIGDPASRYREDPVRIVRVIRFAAKLGCGIEEATRAPIVEMAALLDNVPASRLFDEMIKLLQTGHALASVEQLRAFGLHRGVFPILGVALDDRSPQPARDRFVQLALADTDRRVGEGKPVAPGFLLACLLWHEVQGRWQDRRDAGEPVFPALQAAIDEVFEARIGDISGRGKLAADMREIWAMQPRFDKRSGSGPLGLVDQPRFRAGFDFMRLRAEAGEIDPALAAWWEAFSQARLDNDNEAQNELLREARQQEEGSRRSAGRVRRVPAARSEADAAPDASAADGRPAEDLPGAEGDAPARKRRRRRRKPGAAGPAEAAAAGED